MRDNTFSGNGSGIFKVIWMLPVVCMVWTGSARALSLHGLVLDGKNPVAEARVRVHGRSDFTLTDENGRFYLESSVRVLGSITITAGKEGWITGGVKISRHTSYTTITMSRVPDEDDPDYDFMTPHKSLEDLRTTPERIDFSRSRSHTKFKENCNICHFEPTCFLCHRDIYDQWTTSQHAQAVTDPWVQNIYKGTDADGNENVGPGYRLDFPDDPGGCADCHAPSAAIRAPGKTDLNVVYNRGQTYPTIKGYKSLEQKEIERLSGSVDAEGVHCDFCHKIKSVDVNDYAGVNGAITLNRTRIIDDEGEAEGRLPKIFAYGPFDDVVDFSPVSMEAITSPMVASYNPLYAKSEYCSACHQHTNEYGIAIIDTYNEWKESAYASAGIECQACHMVPDTQLGLGIIINGDADKFWTPIEERDLSTVKRHDFPGGRADLVQNAATLLVETTAHKESLTVKIEVTNVNSGHHLPTGITIRNMLLLVTPIQVDGDTLAYIGEMKVPEYGGAGRIEDGNYAGYPGKGFALVYGDDQGHTGVMDWQATRIVEDTRIKSKTSDTSVYTFAMPVNPETISIHTRLIYRRAFKPLADIKKWEMDDLTVASDITAIKPHFRK